MSWESSAVYYQDLNRGRRAAGSAASPPPSCADIVDFAEVTALQDEERWETWRAPRRRRPRRRGAPAPTSCCSARRPSTGSPTRSPTRSTSRCCTSPTWSPRRCRGRASSRSASSAPRSRCRTLLHRPDRPHGLSPSCPTRATTRCSTGVIYDELVHGKRARRARGTGRSALIDELWDAGAGGVILGCTELELLVTQADADSRSSPAPPSTSPPRSTGRSYRRGIPDGTLSSTGGHVGYRRSARGAGRR